MSFFSRIQEDLILQEPLTLLNPLQNGLRSILRFRTLQQLPHLLQFNHKLRIFRLILIILWVDLEDSIDIEYQQLRMIRLNISLFIKHDRLQIKLQIFVILFALEISDYIVRG